MRIALVGQPNCGKSTIFNQVAGYKSITSNFPGKTITYTSTSININGTTFELIDLPGTYSLSSSDLAELETRNYLLSGKADVVINVVDSSILIRSLELTLQLLELGIPIIMCLNMIDEALRKGMIIDDKKLSNILGIIVCKSVASKGYGIKNLFQIALKSGAQKLRKPEVVPFSKDVEVVIEKLINRIDEYLKDEIILSKRLMAVKLLERDSYFIEKVQKKSPEMIEEVESLRKILEKSHGKTSDQVISSERHSLAMNIFEDVVEVKHGKRTTLRDKFDNWLLHRYLGYLFLFIIPPLRI
mgnify:CR=1 FL=1